MLLAISCWTFVRVFVGASATVALENIALRHQLVVLQRSVSRPRFRRDKERGGNRPPDQPASTCLREFRGCATKLHCAAGISWHVATKFRAHGRVRRPVFYARIRWSLTLLPQERREGVASLGSASAACCRSARDGATRRRGQTRELGR